MKFRWRGGTKGFIARSASRAVRRELSRNGGGEQATNSCALIIILIIGIPLALILLQILLLPVELFFALLEKEPLLTSILFGGIVIGIVALIYLQKNGYIQSARSWFSLKVKEITKPIKQMSKFQIAILGLLASLAVMLFCMVFIVAFIIVT